MPNLLITDVSNVNATVGGVALVAENAAKEFRVLNPKTSAAAIGLTIKSGSSFANCPIVLEPGECWVETSAAGESWYVYAETGTVQVNLMAIA